MSNSPTPEEADKLMKDFYRCFPKLKEIHYSTANRLTHGLWSSGILSGGKLKTSANRNEPENLQDS